MTEVDDAVVAIRDGRLVVIPTDTVYGLACTPYRKEPVRRLSELKGRAPEQPIALVAASVDWMLECVPELRGRAALLARTLLPGAFTLILPNPACRFPWLTGARPTVIGVRVPAVAGPGRDVLDRVGAVAATSANLHGEPDPCRSEDIPHAFRSEAVVVDGGELPGVHSTILDLTGVEPVVVREGAVPAVEALARLQSVFAE